MISLRAHFDGKVLIPDNPIDLRDGLRLTLHIDVAEASPQNGAKPALGWMLKNSINAPASTSWMEANCFVGVRSA
jgi:hypothetical protein